jgi:4a-hydroxytetrahydrobiopterin dehydratase
MIASRAMALDLDAIASYTLGRKKLDPAAILGEVAALGARWTVVGDELRLDLPVKPMSAAAGVVDEAAAIADDLDHHPTITVEYAGVKLAINTHDVGGLTMTDLIYAARLERWLRKQGY